MEQQGPGTNITNDKSWASRKVSSLQTRALGYLAKKETLDLESRYTQDVCDFLKGKDADYSDAD